MTNEHQCRESVRESGHSPRFHQCKRSAIRDGYCKQHHPDAVRERNRKKLQKAAAEAWAFQTA